MNSFNKPHYPQFQPEYDQGLEYFPQQPAFLRQPVRICGILSSYLTQVLFSLIIICILSLHLLHPNLISSLRPCEPIYNCAPKSFTRHLRLGSIFPTSCKVTILLSPLRARRASVASLVIGIVQYTARQAKMVVPTFCDERQV